MAAQGGALRMRLGSSLSVMRRSRAMRLFARSVGPFEGAEKFSAEYFQRDQADFVDWFARMVCTEPHSTRLIEQIGGVGDGHRSRHARSLVHRPDARPARDRWSCAERSHARRS